MNEDVAEHRWAHAISGVFSPLIVPTYGVAIAMWLTSLRVLPESSRLLVTLIIAGITGLVPLAFIWGMKRMKLVTDTNVSVRQQRPLPMSITMICYVAAGFFLYSVHAPFWLTWFFYGAAVATGLAGIISIWWKISAHATAMGGLTGLLFWFAVAGIADVNSMALLSAGLILSGAVCTCRIILRCHSLSQTFAGFCLGIASTFGLLALIWQFIKPA